MNTPIQEIKNAVAESRTGLGVWIFFAYLLAMVVSASKK